MSSRGDRIAAQASDRGAANDTVYFTGVSGSHYHEDEDCQHLSQSDPQSGTREQAQSRWLEPCGRCVLSNGVIRS